MKINLLSFKDFYTDGAEFFTHIVSNESIGYHKHDFYEIFYIIEGECEHYQNGKYQTLKAGDIVFLTPDDVHSFRDTKKHKNVRRDIVLPVEKLMRILEYIGANESDIFPSKEQNLYHFSQQTLLSFEKDLNNIAIQQQSDKKFMEKILNVFLVDLFGKVIKYNGPAESIASKAYPIWITRLIQKLSDHTIFNEDVNDIIYGFHYNISYMRRKFKELTGYTITNYRTINQIDYAKALLLTTDYTICTILEKCGFNNQTYFYKKFREIVGITPKQFKDSSKIIKQ